EPRPESATENLPSLEYSELDGRHRLAGDLHDLLVGVSFVLPEDDSFAIDCRECGHFFGKFVAEDDIAALPPVIQSIGCRLVKVNLFLPTSLHVKAEISCNCVDPPGEIGSGRIFCGVLVNADKDLLKGILCRFAIVEHPVTVDKELSLVPVIELT